MSANSPKFELINKSFEWTSVENAVEVYKLPTDLKWPTMYCPKQSSVGDFFFPEFVIRRMNHMHRHRVNATMSRLWYRPSNDSELRTMILWVGSPGCGKTVAVNEIILDCILKLDGIGKANNGTKWQFFLRMNKSIVKFYFNSEMNRVSQKVYKFGSSDLQLLHLNREYESNKNSFVIYEMNENEDCPVIDMPFLLSTSCRDLDKNFKYIEKSAHTKYLYDPMLDFEFKFFLDVCFSFGNSSSMTSKEDYLGRFKLQGGIIRKILHDNFVDPVYSVFINQNATVIALQELAKCSPKNINSTVNSLVGVHFDFITSLQSETYLQFNKGYKKLERFFTRESIPFEFYHLSQNWKVSILSDYIGLAIGNQVSLPVNLQSSSSLALYQVQELMSIYGGILKVPNENYVLSNNFLISSWRFYKCCRKVYEDSIVEHKASNKSFQKHANLAFATPIAVNEAKSLIDIFPCTNKIWNFYGQYLDIPFQQLSTSYVYKSSYHNGAVYDALTANPADKQLFMFQMTLDDLLSHTVKICAFNKVMSGLQLNFPDINDIYFFMIISAHDDISRQHFSYFELASLRFNACYLQEYTSESGRTALCKVISMNSGLKTYRRDLLDDVELEHLTAKEKEILKTIGNIYKDDHFYKFQLSEELYKNLFIFLDFATKIRPFISRAEFMCSNVVA